MSKLRGVNSDTQMKYRKENEGVTHALRATALQFEQDQVLSTDPLKTIIQPVVRSQGQLRGNTQGQSQGQGWGQTGGRK